MCFCLLYFWRSVASIILTPLFLSAAGDRVRAVEKEDHAEGRVSENVTGLRGQQADEEIGLRHTSELIQHAQPLPSPAFLPTAICSPSVPSVTRLLTFGSG